MENRFGVRDAVVCLLLLALLVSVWLAMVQYDRQWNDVKALRNEVRSLATTQNQMRSALDELRSSIAQGVTVPTNNASAPAGPLKDSFNELREARSKPDFAEGDVLVDAFGTKIKSVTALTYKDAYGRRIQSYVIESLAVLDDDSLELKPHLAASWTVEDHTAAYESYLQTKRDQLRGERPADLDEAGFEQWMQKQIREDAKRPPAMVITFTLRTDARFSDGQPLTAHDVQYSWELLNNPLVNAPETRNFYDNVETYRAIDDYTVRFTFREPHYQALEMVSGFGVLPKHFYSRFTVDDLNRRPGLLLGSGPYRMEDPESWTPGVPMKLVRNENYWGPKSGADAMIWLEIEQDVPRLTAFKNGMIDLFSPSPEQYFELKDDPKVRATFNAHEFLAVPSGYSFVAWNIQRSGKPTIFADARVRRAMTMLIDRERLVQEVMLGLASVTSGPFDEASPQSDPSISPWPFDPGAALALLAECGWKPGADGVLRNGAGDPLAFTLTYPSGNDTYERIMLLLKDSFNASGVLMTQDPQEWSVFIERVDARNFDACSLAWGGGAIEGDIRQMFHSSQIAGGANNFTHYVNADLDRQVDLARRTLDRTARMKLWQACHRILHEDQPYTFLLRRKTTALIHQRIRNIRRTTTGLNERTEWYVPAELQLRGK